MAGLQVSMCNGNDLGHPG